MVNLCNRNVTVGANIPAPGPVPNPRGHQIRGGRNLQAQVNPNQPPPPANAATSPNEYHRMLGRMSMSNNAITALEDLGLDSMDAFCDITTKDIPSMIKELRQNNILVRQTSQNYLHASHCWVMRQERLQVNYMPEDFDEMEMRESIKRYQTSLEPLSCDLIKKPEIFKEKVKWCDFSEAFTTFMQRTKGQCDFPLSYILRDNENREDLSPDD